jgi:tungstate transport system ATP-binding protein
MNSKGPLYQLKDLLFRYGERFELNVPDFSVESGAALGLIGPNGGGKTTLLRILAFIDRPHGGTIFFDGKRANIEDSNLTRSVSMLLQEPYLLKRTVFENVAYGLKVRGERKRLKEKVDEALAMVGLDYREFARRSWYELSGGEAQRVALGSRLILKPRVLILDEPTASVDEKSALLIKDAVIESRKRDGTTLIIASHDHYWLNSITGDIRRVYRGCVLGTAVRNVISGPWGDMGEGLCRAALPDGQTIVASCPPLPDMHGMIDPSDIVISLNKPTKMSAQNMLHAAVISLEMNGETGIMNVSLDAGGFRVLARVTRHTAREMNLLPGEKVWAVFKASSVKWE